MTDNVNPASFVDAHKIDMLNEPLLTEEGFINPVCLAELEAAIRNMPKTYERCSSDPEWATAYITTRNEIMGYFACWAVRQAEGHHCPPKLENVLGYLDACLTFEMKHRIKEEGHADFIFDFWSLCDINQKLWEILGGLPEFVAWNDTDVMGSGFIDLDALLHNVCISIRSRRRHDYAFDTKFEREYGPLSEPDNPSSGGDQLPEGSPE